MSLDFILGIALSQGFGGADTAPSGKDMSNSDMRSYASTAAYVALTITNMRTQSLAAQAQRDIYNIRAESARELAQIEAQAALGRARSQGKLIEFLGEAKAANIEMVSKAQALTMDIQSDIQLAIAGANESLALMRSEDALRRGQERIARKTQETKKTVGAQRAILAASGVDINSGSAADVQGEQKLVGRVDAITIGVNAKREAFGFRNEAINATLAGRLASNKSLYEAERAKLTGEFAPDIVRRDAQGRALITNMFGEAQATAAIHRGASQSLQFGYMSDVFGQRATTGPMETLITAGIDYAVARGTFV